MGRDFEKAAGIAIALLQLFGKGKRAELIMRILEKRELVDHFKSARTKIDEVARLLEGGAVTPAPPLSNITAEETIALDTFLDLTRHPKRTLRGLLRGG